MSEELKHLRNIVILTVIVYLVMQALPGCGAEAKDTGAKVFCEDGKADLALTGRVAKGEKK